MNHDKARDLFSAYYEGTLEGGLRQQFENRLAQDNTLRADYAAFSETMESLALFAEEEIEIPIYLNDRIATRLEQEEAKRAKRAPAFLAWLRYSALTGLATTAIVTSVLALNKSNSVATAGFTTSDPSNTNVDHLDFSIKGSDVLVHLTGDASKSLVISSEPSGRVIRRLNSDHTTVEVPLHNENPYAALLKVSSGDLDRATVAIPGKMRDKQPTFSGNLSEFAAAVADRYGIPVVVRGELKTDLTYTFENGSALKNMETALQSAGASVDQREGGMITVLVD